MAKKRVHMSVNFAWDVETEDYSTDGQFEEETINEIISDFESIVEDALYGEGTPEETPEITIVTTTVEEPY